MNACSTSPDEERTESDADAVESSTTTSSTTTTTPSTTAPETTTTTEAPEPEFDSAGFVAALKDSVGFSAPDLANNIVGADLDFDEVVVEMNLYPKDENVDYGMLICTMGATIAEDLGYERLVVVATGGEYLAQARPRSPSNAVVCRPWEG